MKTDDRITGFTDTIWSWYDRHKRTLPWRDMAIEDDTERAYRVFVSEMMLQQTQVSRVIVIFKRFLEQFPTLQDLAKASNKEVILAWKGMGYNSRALRMRDAAKTIVEKYNGMFPRNMEELLSIKGIGPYTAAAIRNFAFNIPTPCIDTNIRRILERTFIDVDEVKVQVGVKEKELMRIADKVLEKALSKKSKSNRDAANWHAALMDFGSLVQTKSNPKWDICPLTEKGLMKTTQALFETQTRNEKRETKNEKLEPGRVMGSKYIPNRIFRGRIVDSLREHPEGLTFDQIGKEICIDWGNEHHLWLLKIIRKLEEDGMLRQVGESYELG